MRNRIGRQTGTSLALLAVIAVVIAACSGSSAATAGPAAVDSYGGDGQGMAAPSAAASEAAAPQPGRTTPDSANQAQPDNNLQIVYTGSLELVVSDVEQALAKGKTAVAAAGGYIGASQEANRGDQPTATITYRIPASRWEDTIGALRSIGTKVVSEQTQASEVGGQLVDLQARIANLRASEAALQGIAQNTAKVSDLLEVQARLSDVRGQIEELDAQRARLADQVAYGTLVTTFGLEVAQVKEAAKGWDPATDVDGATATMLSVGQHLVSGGIWFAIVWVPLLLVLTIAGFISWRLFRRFSPRPDDQGGPVAGWGGDLPPEA
ncbi:MAG TPA: DUF4349 domain-containing protein [Candidatus Limnocylindrales bacterium]